MGRSNLMAEKYKILKSVKSKIVSHTKHNWCLTLQQAGVNSPNQLFRDSLNKHKLFIVEEGIPTNKYYLKDLAL